MPKTVAMVNAKRGFSPRPSTVAGNGSMDGFIGIVLVLLGQAAISFRYVFFVKDGIGDHVCFRSPGAEIEQAATVAAERKIGILVGIRGLFANGAFMFHSLRKVLPQSQRTRQRGKKKARRGPGAGRRWRFG